MGGHVPRRRCVGCGRVAPKPELVRIAIAAGDEPLAVIDGGGRMPGRGAYLCGGRHGAPATSCLAQALRRRAIQRTLRAPVAVDPKIVESVSG